MNEFVAAEKSEIKRANNKGLKASIECFMESSDPCRKYVCKDVNSAQTLSCSIYKVRKRTGLNVFVVRRGNTVYILKERIV